MNLSVRNVHVGRQLVIHYPVNYRWYHHELYTEYTATGIPAICGEHHTTAVMRSHPPWRTPNDKQSIRFKQNNFLIGLFEDEEERNLIKRTVFIEHTNRRES